MDGEILFCYITKTNHHYKLVCETPTENVVITSQDKARLQRIAERYLRSEWARNIAWITDKKSGELWAKLADLAIPVTLALVSNTAGYAAGE